MIAFCEICNNFINDNDTLQIHGISMCSSCCDNYDTRNYIRNCIQNKINKQNRNKQEVIVHKGDNHEITRIS